MNTPTLNPQWPSQLETKTLTYWIMQMHWNGREAVTKKIPGKCPTVSSAIADCNNIMKNLDPNRPLSKLAFEFQSNIINRQEPNQKAAASPSK